MLFINRTSLVRQWFAKLGRRLPNDLAQAALHCRMDDDIRRATAEVILEEAIELIEALGCRVHTRGSREIVTRGSLTVELDGRRSWGTRDDFIAALHEYADCAFVIENVPALLGIDGDVVFQELYTSNLTSIRDGKILRSEEKRNDPGYHHPDIAGALARAGESPRSAVWAGQAQGGVGNGSDHLVQQPGPGAASGYGAGAAAD